MSLIKNTGTEKNQILHHKNAPCHTSLTVWQFLVNNKIPATTFSTSPSATFKASKLGSKAIVMNLLRKFSNNFAHTHIHTQKTRDVTASLPHSHTKRALPRYFQQWQDHWRKCLAAEDQQFVYDQVMYYSYNFYYKLCPSSKNFLTLPQASVTPRLLYMGHLILIKATNLL